MIVVGAGVGEPATNVGFADGVAVGDAVHVEIAKAEVAVIVLGVPLFDSVRCIGIVPLLIPLTVGRIAGMAVLKQVLTIIDPV